ncbi:MAG: hydrogenase maturation protease [Phycisphaerales bacterium]|jgi:hydrogenase maturation protease
MNKEVAVLGIGNILMSDEGIGPRLIEKLNACNENFPFAEFIDVGTRSMSLLHLMANRRKAIIVDCALMGTSPGTIKRFTPQDVSSIKQLRHFSLHEADVLGIIEMSRRLGQCPKDIVIFGIEPKSIELGQSLSNTLWSKLSNYTQTICRELTCD